MSTENPVRCPNLLSLGYHDNLVASTLSNLVGTLVEFRCTGITPILSGSSGIRCDPSGKWNDTVPTCLPHEIEDSTTFTEYVSVTPTMAVESADEPEVETVLIVLWIAGGLLLMTLVILIGCILKTHKKQRRHNDRSRRFPPQGQGDPSHGGVNPTFTSYDEIWTWIPVVTGNAENCRNQSRDQTSANESRANELNNNARRSSRLPSYNEAVVNSAVNRSTQNATSSRPQPTSGYTPNGATNQPTLQIRPIIPNVANQTSGGVRVATCSSGLQDVYQAQTNRTDHADPMERNHYETIPADLERSRPLNSGNNVTYVSVTSSSGSALQQARDLVNGASAHARRPVPSAPIANSLNRLDAHTAHRQLVNRSVPSRVISSQYNPTRTPTSGLTHSVYLPRYNLNTTQDFTHSHSSVFRQVANSTSQHVPTLQDNPPPPYSITRNVDQPVSSVRISAPSVTVSSYNRGLESHYF